LLHLPEIIQTAAGESKGPRFKCDCLTKMGQFSGSVWDKLSYSPYSWIPFKFQLLL